MAMPGARPAHCLPGELVVTLASHRPRFPTLHRTLASLLRQTLRPDRVILWVPEEQFRFLPSKVRSLAGPVLEIRDTKNIGSYAKLIPALRELPSAYLVTADDDVFYEPRWLE